MFYEMMTGVLLIALVAVWLFRPTRYLIGADWQKVETALLLVTTVYGPTTRLQFDAEGNWSVSYCSRAVSGSRWSVAAGYGPTELYQWADNALAGGVVEK